MTSQTKHGDSRRPTNHNQYRRMFGHDYTIPCVYLITLHKTPSAPILSIVDDYNPSHPLQRIDAIPTPYGAVIVDAIAQFNSLYDSVKIHKRVIMPDHIHFIVVVSKVTPRPLGAYIAKFKALCNFGWKNIIGENTHSLLVDGYNDRVLFGHGQWHTWNNYILDNPRRLAIRRAFRDKFARHLVHLSDGRSLPAYGDPGLVSFPLKALVRFSSRFSEDQLAAIADKAYTTGKAGGVVVSPMIHQWERDICNKLVLSGCRILKVIAQPFGLREKPSGRLFDLCAQGRLAFVSLFEKPLLKQVEYTRSLCLELNKVAALLCGLEAEPGFWL